MSEKSEEKCIEVQREKPPIPTRAIDTHTGDAEETGKKKKEQEKERERAFNPPTSLDHSFDSYKPSGVIR